MSERKVLSKYYPPDFDPAAITRTRTPKSTGPKVITVRLMAPFSMKCTSCGEYIYKGRKFNARKETTDEKYYSIAIYRFYIRCTRCSAEITFKTDPKNMDYTCEKGAKRNFEVWRQGDGEGGVVKEETDEERLDRLEREEVEKGAMGVLEGKVEDARREMEIADKLDEIRTRNARNERAQREGLDEDILRIKESKDKELERIEQEEAEMARRAYMTESGEKVRRVVAEEAEDDSTGGLGALSIIPAKPKSTKSMESIGSMLPPPPPPTFQRVVKKKKDLSAALGIKKKPALI
ncbi:MAG: hypothetical protein MMC33_006816 [Icmadophila ericetorum]|nr:hypothetical protein [Icmadophila ericetorum]